jgi:hypothetical protein
MHVSGQLHTPCHFTPQERALGTNEIESWVGPTVDLDAIEKRKSRTAGSRNPAVQGLARH